MPNFDYIALDAKGQEMTGSVDAGTQTDAIGLIRERGLFPINIDEKNVGGLGSRPRAKGGKGRTKKQAKGILSKEINIRIPGWRYVKGKHVMTFTRQLATLIDAGLPLVRGLRVLERQEKNVGLKGAIRDLSESIESGATFSESLALHPKIFNRLYVNMVKAGEIGGILEIVLNRLAEFMEKSQSIRNKIKAAMIYPLVVLIMALGIVIFLIVYIVPRFEDIFEDMLMGEQLPELTRLVLGMSRGFIQYWYVLLGFIVCIGFACALANRTPSGRYVLDWLKLKSPIFGILFSRTAIARFSRTLGTLMNSGVPVLQSLNIVRNTSASEVLARAVDQVHDSVKEGESMASPIDSSGFFPPIVVSMVEVGEETGELPAMLVRIADTYEDEVDNAVAGITSIIEPILIVFLALIVGTIVIALFLPLIGIISNLSR